MDLGLQGKVVLVTGRSNRIGRAIAVQCASEVADVTWNDEVLTFVQASAATPGGINMLIENVGGKGL